MNSQIFLWPYFSLMGHNNSFAIIFVSHSLLVMGVQSYPGYPGSWKDLTVGPSYRCAAVSWSQPHSPQTTTTVSRDGVQCTAADSPYITFGEISGHVFTFHSFWR